MLTLSERSLASLSGVLPEQQYRAVALLKNELFESDDELLRAVKNALGGRSTSGLCQEIIDSAEVYAAGYAFLFTRSRSKDYHFARFPELDDGRVRDAVVCLQDYFSSVVDGVGYYSFRAGDRWITAEILRTGRRDHVSRPIYEIRGQFHAAAEMGNSWFAFAPRDAMRPPAGAHAFPPGEYAASPETLAAFLDYCDSLPAPISWGYGIASRAGDANELEISVRFVPGRKQPRPGWWRRVFSLPSFAPSSWRAGRG